MGQEITTSHFSPDDFQHFKQRLQQETEKLETWFLDKNFPAIHLWPVMKWKPG